MVLQGIIGYKQGAVCPSEYAEPTFSFQNLSFNKINNQQAKFDKKFSAGSVSVERH